MENTPTSFPDFKEVLEAQKRSENYYTFSKKDEKIVLMALANLSTIEASIKRDGTFDLSLYQTATTRLEEYIQKANINQK